MISYGVIVNKTFVCNLKNVKPIGIVRLNSSKHLLTLDFLIHLFDKEFTLVYFLGSHLGDEPLHCPEARSSQRLIS